MFPRLSRKDLRSAFASQAFAPGDDGDDEDDDGGEGEGSSGTGAEGGEGGSSGSTGKDSSEAIKDPEKKRLSDEAAARRLEAKQAKKERDELAAKLQKFEDADKSELELAQRTATEASARAEKLEAQLAEKNLRLAMYDSGAAAMLTRPQQAIKLMDLSTLTPDEDTGEYDAKALLTLTEAWLKENPHFAATGTDDDTDEEKPPSGRPLNPRKNDNAKNKDLIGKYPALAGRISG
jgi:hypothetical protein